jgi:hypothetical protein
MLAITTKYHGPTNSRGSRISASVQNGDFKKRIYIGYPYELSPTGDAVYRAAAEAMCQALQGEGYRYAKPDQMISGFHNGKDYGYIFVFTPEAAKD